MGDKIVEIVPYDPKYAEIFENYRTIILGVLPYVKVQLIGNVAVPMKGKKEIDVLVIAEDVLVAQEVLQKAGFHKGPIYEGEAYATDYRYNLECEVHLLPEGDRRISRINDLIKFLQEHDDVRSRYEEFKESCNGLSIREYRNRKADYIRENIPNFADLTPKNF